MVRTGRYVRAEKFWGPILVGNFFSLVVGMIILGVVALDMEETKTSLLGKEALFCAMAGQPTDKYEAAGGHLKDMVTIGAYLREQSQKEPSQKVLVSAVLVGRLFQGLNPDEAERQKAALILEGKIPPEAIEGLSSNQWTELASNPWDYQVMSELLGGSRKKAPIWNYDYSLRWFWLAVVLAVQLGGFGFFLGSSHGRDDDRKGRLFHWYQLPWHRVWPVLGFVLLMPGALPLMIPAWLRYLFSAERRKKRGQKKQGASTVASEGAGEELLTRLRKRLDGHV